MDFGMPTLIEAADIDSCTALCAELGLGFVELNMNLPQYQADAVDASHLLAAAKRSGLYYTIHLDENLNPADFNPYVAQAYLRTALDTLALAKEIGAPVVNMHLPRGVYFTLPEGRVHLFEVYRERYLADMARFRDACSAAAGSDVSLCVENCDGYLPFQQEALRLLLESPSFALTYDAGHDHGCGGRDKPFILAHRDRLAHMHLHDAKGTKNHLALGTGDLDICGCLALAQQTHSRVVLETKTVEGLRQSVRWVRETGRL